MFRGTDQIDWLKNDLKTIKVVFSCYLDMRDKKILLQWRLFLRTPLLMYC